MNSFANPSDILIEVLNIIHYQGNKKAFAERFNQTCLKKALADLYLALPNDRKIELEKLSQKQLSYEDLLRKVKKIINEKVYQESLQKTTEVVFQSFLETIYLTLSDSQKNKLHVYIESIGDFT